MGPGPHRLVFLVFETNDRVRCEEAFSRYALAVRRAQSARVSRAAVSKDAAKARNVSENGDWGRQMSAIVR